MFAVLEMAQHNFDKDVSYYCSTTVASMIGGR